MDERSMIIAGQHGQMVRRFNLERWVNWYKKCFVCVCFQNNTREINAMKISVKL